MNYEIEIQPARVKYKASVDDTLLSAALANKFCLEHSCRSGECGLCSATIVSGTVKNEFGDLVTEGNVLTCCSYPQSDITLLAKFLPELSDIECKTLPCKLVSKSLVNHDILILTLRFPPKTNFKYLAGQYIDLIYQGLRRSYSIANAQSSLEGLELHIRLIADGQFSQVLIRDCNENQLMRIEGPKGTFFVREATNPIIFLAGGTGFAPVKAMMENLLHNKVNREIYIYWGMAHSDGFYTKIADDWAREYSHISYVSVVSADDKCWQGRRGFVHQVVLDDFSDLSKYHVYACGSPLMISSAKDAFISRGLNSEHFYADIFVSSK